MRTPIPTDWKFLALSAVVLAVTESAGLANAEVCNWGNGTSTPQALFSQSCLASGGTPNGCTCLRNGPGGNSNYQYWYNQGYNNAAARQQQQQQAQQLQQQQVEQQAEQQRQSELARQRSHAEALKRQAEAARKAQFIEDRDATAATLKEGIGDAGELKGADGLNAATPGLKGLGSTSDRSRSATLAKSKTGRTAKPDPCSADYGPRVVNGCGVPSGLPKFVDASIPHTPSGERVRKGYEAIQSGTPDRWDVALAYFQEAHKLNPHDAGINRLIDLAEYTRAEEKGGKANAAATPSTRNQELARQLDAFAHHKAPSQTNPAAKFAPRAPSDTEPLHASDFHPLVPDRLKGIDHIRVPAPATQPTPRSLWQRLLDIYKQGQVRKVPAVAAVRG